MIGRLHRRLYSAELQSNKHGCVKPLKTMLDDRRTSHLQRRLYNTSLSSNKHHNNSLLDGYDNKQYISKRMQESDGRYY